MEDIINVLEQEEDTQKGRFLTFALDKESFELRSDM